MKYYTVVRSYTKEAVLENFQYIDLQDSKAMKCVLSWVMDLTKGEVNTLHIQRLLSRRSHSISIVGMVLAESANYRIFWRRKGAIQCLEVLLLTGSHIEFCGEYSAEEAGE